MEYLTIIPGDGEYQTTARSLLAIVGPGREHEVETVTYPGHGFRVPADVLIEHVRRLGAASEPTPPAAPESVSQPEAPVAPAPDPVAVPAPTPAKRTPRRRGQTP